MGGTDTVAVCPGGAEASAVGGSPEGAIITAIVPCTAPLLSLNLYLIVSNKVKPGGGL